MSELREVVVLSLAGIGCVFVLLAGVGLVRMPDLYSRMQAASKASALGAVCATLAVAVHFGSAGVLIRALVLCGFLFLTIPIAAHLIVRAGHVAGAPPERGTFVDDICRAYGREAGHPEQEEDVASSTHRDA